MVVEPMTVMMTLARAVALTLSFTHYCIYQNTKGSGLDFAIVIFKSKSNYISGCRELRVCASILARLVMLCALDLTIEVISNG